SGPRRPLIIRIPLLPGRSLVSRAKKKAKGRLAGAGLSARSRVWGRPLTDSLTGRYGMVTAPPAAITRRSAHLPDRHAARRQRSRHGAGAKVSWLADHEVAARRRHLDVLVGDVAGEGECAAAKHQVRGVF